MKIKGKTFSGSKGLIFLIAVFWLSVIVVYKPWKKNLIVNDIVSYYAYLPATFIHHDLRLDFIKNDPANKFRFWPERADNGGKVIKTTMGLSIMYAPFFLAGHAVALLSGASPDGFSTPYQMAVMIGGFFYFILGLFFLRKILLIYFSERVTILTILSVYAGTNLFWYSTLDNFMSHQYVFSLLCIFIYQVIKWHREQKLRTAIFIGLTGGLLTLIRPTMLFCFLIFALFNIYNSNTLKQKWKLLLNNKRSLLIIATAAALVFLPQFLYWKYVTGQWFFFSYIGERFYFDNPHLTEGLFGFRKGWLLYTPIMLFAFLGLPALKKKIPVLFLPVVFILFSMIYILLSWWAWWYGGTFGNRAFIDWYPLFVLPIAGFYSVVLEQGKRILKTIIFSFAGLFCCLNLFQTWQCNTGLLHYDSMTKEAYLLGFFSTTKTEEWERSLEEPAYGRAVKGLSESYSEAEINAIRPEDVISLKGSNKLVVSAELNGSKELQSSKNYVATWETFSFIRKEGNKIAIMAYNKKYVCADKNHASILAADKDWVGPWETFELVYLGDNKIALKADNGKYVGISKDHPFVLAANSDVISSAEKFRIYIN